jgi:hypothetical protein
MSTSVEQFKLMTPEQAAQQFVTDHTGGKSMASVNLPQIISILTSVFSGLKGLNIPLDKIVPFIKDLTTDIFAGNWAKVVQDVLMFIALWMSPTGPVVNPNAPKLP